MQCGFLHTLAEIFGHIGFPLFWFWAAAFQGLLPAGLFMFEYKWLDTGLDLQLGEHLGARREALKMSQTCHREKSLLSGLFLS